MDSRENHTATGTLLELTHDRSLTFWASGHFSPTVSIFFGRMGEIIYNTSTLLRFGEGLAMTAHAQ
jgi:hypothetical protein